MDIDVAAQLISDFQGRAHTDRKQIKDIITGLDALIHERTRSLKDIRAKHEKVVAEGSDREIIHSRSLVDEAQAQLSHSRFQLSEYEWHLRRADQDYILGQVAQGMMSKLIEMGECSFDVEVD